MMREIGKRLTALVLTAAMAIVMPGCGSTETTENRGSEEPAVQETVQETQQEEASSGKEFSYFGAIWSPYQESSPIFDELMKRTGITVDFEWVNQDGFDTLLASKVAAQDLPDVINGGTVAPTAINDLISQGLIVTITDYLNNELSNY